MLNIRFHRSSAPITDDELVSVIDGIRPAIAAEDHPDRDYALLLAKLVLRLATIRGDQEAIANSLEQQNKGPQQ